MSAEISVCTTYRYMLERVWGDGESRLLVIGLNPSTADAARDDPTIRRCVGFAKREGLDGLLVGNLFAARSAKPTFLTQIADPIGPENDYWLSKLHMRASVTIVAWGAGGQLQRRGRIVASTLQGGMCFGLTVAGEPRHPLYVRANAPLIQYPIVGL